MESSGDIIGICVLVAHVGAILNALTARFTFGIAFQRGYFKLGMWLGALCGLLGPMIARLLPEGDQRSKWQHLKVSQQGLEPNLQPWLVGIGLAVIAGGWGYYCIAELCMGGLTWFRIWTAPIIQLAFAGAGYLVFRTSMPPLTILPPHFDMPPEGAAKAELDDFHERRVRVESSHFQGIYWYIGVTLTAVIATIISFLVSMLIYGEYRRAPGDAESYWPWLYCGSLIAVALWVLVGVFSSKAKACRERVSTILGGRLSTIDPLPDYSNVNESNPEPLIRDLGTLFSDELCTDCGERIAEGEYSAECTRCSGVFHTLCLDSKGMCSVCTMDVLQGGVYIGVCTFCEKRFRPEDSVWECGSCERQFHLECVAMAAELANNDPTTPEGSSDQAFDGINDPFWHGLCAVCSSRHLELSPPCDPRPLSPPYMNWMACGGSLAVLLGILSLLIWLPLTFMGRAALLPVGSVAGIGFALIVLGIVIAIRGMQLTKDQDDYDSPWEMPTYCRGCTDLVEPFEPQVMCKMCKQIYHTACMHGDGICRHCADGGSVPAAIARWCSLQEQQEKYKTGIAHCNRCNHEFVTYGAAAADHCVKCAAVYRALPWDKRGRYRLMWGTWLFIALFPLAIAIKPVERFWPDSWLGDVLVTLMSLVIVLVIPVYIAEWVYRLVKFKRNKT